MILWILLSVSAAVERPAPGNGPRISSHVLLVCGKLSRSARERDATTQLLLATGRWVA
jgi:hypothetical protein